MPIDVEQFRRLRGLYASTLEGLPFLQQFERAEKAAFERALQIHEEELKPKRLPLPSPEAQESVPLFV